VNRAQLIVLTFIAAAVVVGAFVFGVLRMYAG
jgi:hypothetical protein